MISILPYGEIHLGRRFEHQFLTDRVAPHVHRLRPGTFGGAEYIEIRTDEAGTVRGMLFGYEPGTFDERVAHYTTTLGSPWRMATTDSTAREAWWADSVTRFGLVEERGGTAAVFAVLLDGGG